MTFTLTSLLLQSMFSSFYIFFSSFFRRCLDKFHDIVHSFHELDLSVGDFDIELVLEFTDEADHVVGGEAEVIDEMAVGVDGVCGNVLIFADDGNYFI